jgi:GTP pyrophosphokinase
MDQVDIDAIQGTSTVEGATALLQESITLNDKIRDALVFATDAHKEQFRKSGEPYIIHPILVASIVAKITEDESMVMAALLHDVVEDTPVTIDEVKERYGDDVAHLVGGLTKIDSLRDANLVSSASDEKLIVSALSFRKMLLASIEDVRVLVVKLCDRLHNMLTLEALPPHKQERIAEETLVVYAPVAHRLGISFVKNLLEDLSFKYVFPHEEQGIEKYLSENYHAIELKLNAFQQEVTKLILQNGFMQKDFQIKSRVKHHYSIYLKLQRKGIGIDEILDLLAVRIMVRNPVDCYKILGLVHLHFQPLSSRFKDYIAIAKENGYQTIHTTIFHHSSILEVQIRTFEMNRTAELGVAAHWKYKSGGNNIKLDWLNNLGYQNESVEDFYALIKNDLYSEDIAVFSPRGEAFTLPRGAVVLDFAYAVHTEVGNTAKSALVNKMKTPLLSELHNGDIVKINSSDEIITRCSWIDAVKTSKAKTNMRFNCNARVRDINAKSSVNIVATAMNLNHSRVEEWFDRHNCEKRASIPVDIEHLRDVMHRYTIEISKNSRFKRFLSRHRFKLKRYNIRGTEIYSTSHISDIVFDYCCHPKSGDEIVAFLEKGKAHIHHKMCKSAIKKLEKNESMLFVRWEKQNIYNYNVIVSLPSGKGTLADFLNFLVKLNIDINSIELGKNKSETSRYCELEFESKEADINSLRAKMEQKIKVIHLIRTDDAYR